MKPDEKNENDIYGTPAKCLITILERVMKESDCDPETIADEDEQLPEISRSDALDADMRSSLLMIRHFCNVHQCRKFSSKFCACCQGHLENVHIDLEHHINRSAIDALLKETELPSTETKPSNHEETDATPRETKTHGTNS